MKKGEDYRVFECKTCNRGFPSFQALGGHRASHKKPRLLLEDDVVCEDERKNHKKHECSVCGLDFPVGQALGGHMRRHRRSMTISEAPSSGDHHQSFPSLSVQVPAVKKGNSGRRVLCLDLNLSPLENDLNLQFRGGFSERSCSPVLKNFF